MTVRVAQIGLRGISHEISGGIETVVRLLIQEPNDGVNYIVYTRSRFQKTSDNNPPSVRVIRLPTVYLKHFETFVYSILAVAHAICTCEVIHIHGVAPSIFTPFCRLAGKPVLVTVHGDDWKRLRWGKLASLWIRFSAQVGARYANAVVAVGEEVARSFAGEFGRKPIVIRNGINLKPPQEVMPQKKKNIVYLGRLVPEKKCDLLIEAFLSLKTDWELLIAGDHGSDDVFYSRLLELSYGNSRVHFLGAVYGPAKERLISECGIFVLPSAIEGLPLVLLEALSLSACVLCSDIPQNLEVILKQDMLTRRHKARDAVMAGMTFQTGNLQDLIFRLKALIDDERQRVALSNGAYAHVQQYFSFERSKLNYQLYFKKLAGLQRRSK